jgi:hypothetical protein
MIMRLEEHRAKNTLALRSWDALFAKDCALPQVFLQHLRGLVQGVPHRRHLADRVEQPVVVDQVIS